MGAFVGCLLVAIVLSEVVNELHKIRRLLEWDVLRKRGEDLRKGGR